MFHTKKMFPSNLSFVDNKIFATAKQNVLLSPGFVGSTACLCRTPLISALWMNIGRAGAEFIKAEETLIVIELGGPVGGTPIVPSPQHLI